MDEKTRTAAGIAAGLQGLVYDDKRLAEMVSNYLSEAGFATAIARNGASGIALHALRKRLNVP